MRAGVLLSASALAVLAAFTACSDNTPTRPLRPGAARADVIGEIVVSNTNDAGPGSLRQAIADAPDGGINIHFAPALAGKTITVLTPLSVAHNLAIEARATAPGITIDGNGLSTVFDVPTGGNLTLRRLTVSRGSGIASITVALGGTLVVDHSTVSGGRLDGIRSDGDLTITNSTISSNVVGVRFSGKMTLVQSTIANNTGVGIKLVNHPSMFFYSPIIAGNALDCEEGSGYTLDGKGAFFMSNGTCFNSPLTDAKLGPLADNGGPTKTHAPLRTSPVIDVTDCFVADDQRGIARPQFAKCDAGAVEFNNFLNVPIVVSPNAYIDPTTGSALVSGTISCAEVMSPTIIVVLAQPEKVKGVSILTQASEDVSLDCIGTKLWSVVITPPAGTAFIAGAAAVSIQLIDIPPFVGTSSQNQAVKLVRAKK